MKCCHLFHNVPGGKSCRLLKCSMSELFRYWYFKYFIEYLKWHFAFDIFIPLMWAENVSVSKGTCAFEFSSGLCFEANGRAREKSARFIWSKLAAHLHLVTLQITSNVSRILTIFIPTHSSASVFWLGDELSDHAQAITVIIIDNSPKIVNQSFVHNEYGMREWVNECISRLIEARCTFNSLSMNGLCLCKQSTPLTLLYTLNILIYYRNKHASKINAYGKRFFFSFSDSLYRLIPTYSGIKI